MGRNPRIHFDGAVYHAMARGVDGRDIFVDDRDREAFLTELTRAETDTGARVIAHCLMGNHFHLVIQVGRVPLSSIMQRLLTCYALVFNRRHNRTGHLFQARYKAKVCLGEAYLFRLIQYVHLNPVRAGLVSKIQDWPWSSHKKHSATDQDGDFSNFDPWSDDESGVLVRRQTHSARTLRDIERLICRDGNISVHDLRSGNYNRRVVSARRRFTQEAVREGHQLIAISQWLGSAASSISRYARQKVQMQRLTPSLNLALETAHQTEHAERRGE